MKNRIARQLIFYTILFSSVITLIITAIQLFNEFQLDVKGIHQKLEQIDISHKESITNSAWLSDRNQLQLILDGITELPDIVYSTVNLKDEEDIESGHITKGDIIEKSLNLNFYYNEKNINIGKFVVVASLTDVYNRLINRLWVILLSNAIKTFFVALFIYFIFSQLVTRHLVKISEFAEGLNLLSDNKLLTLNRTAEKTNEFDTLVNSINNMQHRLNTQATELNQQKQYLSQTLNSIGDAVITTDTAGNVTRLNPVAERLTGWSSADACGKSVKMVFSIVNSSTQKPIENPIEKVLSTGETVFLSNHTMLISKDGSKYQIADSAAPILQEKGPLLGMVLVFNDVTEQYRLRQKIISSEKRYQTLAKVAPVGIYYTDRNGHCLYVNEKWSELTGISAEDAMGDGWIKGLHPDDREYIFAEWEKSTHLNIPFQLEYRFQHAEGSHWVFGQALAEYDENNNIIGYVGTITDITDRKNTESALRRAQKMDALGKLTGGIAHDYNNMLGVVLGYTELLQNSLGDQPKLLKYAREIQHAGERGSKLTRKLLAFSRQKASNASPLDLNQSIRNEQHMLEKTLTARIKLVLELEDELWTVKLDNSDLEDAILNLSINASHAIEGNGRLTIDTMNLHIADVEAQTAGISAGDYVMLSMTDTGSGIDESVRDKIFDPFFSTKGEQGTGLGLSQVYGFVERSGGTIKVHSEAGQGTCIEMYFPRLLADPTDSKKPSARQKTDLQGTENILLVDDEPALLSLAEEILTQQGYTTYLANSARQALETLDRHPVDLIVSDVIMPEMDGYELAAIVQQKYPGIKIQLASGFSDERHKNNTCENLHQNLLYKPYTSDALLQQIRKLLDSDA